jgi:putative transposase
LLTVRIVPPVYADARAELKQVFSDAGLPATMRSGNDPPFGSAGVGGLLRLSVWLLRLGVEVRLIPPRPPPDNGRHE